MYRAVVGATSSRRRPTPSHQRSSGTQRPILRQRRNAVLQPSCHSKRRRRRSAAPGIHGEDDDRNEEEGPEVAGASERIVGIQCNWLRTEPHPAPCGRPRLPVRRPAGPRNHNDQQEQSETARTDRPRCGRLFSVCTSCGSSTIRAMSSPETVDGSMPVGSGFMGDARSDCTTERELSPARSGLVAGPLSGCGTDRRSAERLYRSPTVHGTGFGGTSACSELPGPAIRNLGREEPDFLYQYCLLRRDTWPEHRHWKARATRKKNPMSRIRSGG